MIQECKVEPCARKAQSRATAVANETQYEGQKVERFATWKQGEAGWGAMVQRPQGSNCMVAEMSGADHSAGGGAYRPGKLQIRGIQKETPGEKPAGVEKLAGTTAPIASERG
jgi:hypothetical protein